MEFDGPLIEGTLIRRYKRFFADVDVGGETLVAHCPNPGSMRCCAQAGARAWVSISDNPKRKLKYTWELVEIEGAMICVNTMRANRLVEEALKAGVVGELAGWDALRREVRIGDGRSRLDFALDFGGRQCFVEVKNVTLTLGDGIAGFPDSVTARGTKHLAELTGLVEAGHRAVMLFCVGRDDASLVVPADDIDPKYGAALRVAVAAGVEVYAYGGPISPRGLTLDHAIPVEIPPLP